MFSRFWPSVLYFREARLLVRIGSKSVRRSPFDFVVILGYYLAVRNSILPFLIYMHIVLVEPQIPQNTGSISRTCAATDTPLHLVGKLGFDISEKSVRRAGLDYWPYVKLFQHANWEEYMESAKPENVWLFSKYGTRLYTDAAFGPEDALVFGSETKGLGESFLSRFPPEQILRIPIVTEYVRSLNLSNAVSIALYESRRQLKLDH